MRATARLRQLLATSTPLVVPGCYNALSARVLEQVGFPAVYMTGYGTSLSLLGMPDAGLATMTEMHLNARYIANAVRVPVIADAARREADPNFVLIARTDARGAHGGSLDEAIRRANAYLEAGADLAFVEGPTSLDELGRVCREVKGPIFYNQTGVSPRLGREQMAELGIAVTILPGATLRATIEAVHDLAVALRDEGPLAEARFAERFEKHPLGNLHTFAGFDQVRAWEESYLPPEELEKYEGGVGHRPGGR